MKGAVKAQPAGLDYVQNVLELLSSGGGGPEAQQLAVVLKSEIASGKLKIEILESQKSSSALIRGGAMNLQGDSYTIEIDPNLEPTDIAATLIHEYTHAVLNRQITPALWTQIMRNAMVARSFDKKGFAGATVEDSKKMFLLETNIVCAEYKAFTAENVPQIKTTPWNDEDLGAHLNEAYVARSSFTFPPDLMGKVIDVCKKSNGPVEYMAVFEGRDDLAKSFIDANRTTFNTSARSVTPSSEPAAK